MIRFPQFWSNLFWAKHVAIKKFDRGAQECKEISWRQNFSFIPIKLKTWLSDKSVYAKAGTNKHLVEFFFKLHTFLIYCFLPPVSNVVLAVSWKELVFPYNAIISEENRSSFGLVELKYHPLEWKQKEEFKEDLPCI